MEGPEPSGNGDGPIGGKRRESADQVRVRRETLQAVLEQCQRALELLKNADEDGGGGHNLPEEIDDDSSASSVSSQCGSGDSETAELCDLLKSRVESPNFLEKLGSIHMSIPQNVAAEEGSSWDVVSKTDWDEDSDKDDYVVVKQEDIVEGIACFMAAYLLSLNQTKLEKTVVYTPVHTALQYLHWYYSSSRLPKELTPIQLQEALSKTFSVKKRKGKLRKAWDGSKVIYNVASWGATAIGIYQNPALFSAASAAFWTSCRVISKLL